MGVFLMVAVWWLAGRRNFPRSDWVGGAGARAAAPSTRCRC